MNTVKGKNEGLCDVQYDPEIKDPDQVLELTLELLQGSFFSPPPQLTLQTRTTAEGEDQVQQPSTGPPLKT